MWLHLLSVIKKNPVRKRDWLLSLLSPANKNLKDPTRLSTLEHTVLAVQLKTSFQLSLTFLAIRIKILLASGLILYGLSIPHTYMYVNIICVSIYVYVWVYMVEKLHIL
jgi:hypothetical protein